MKREIFNCIVVALFAVVLVAPILFSLTSCSKEKIYFDEKNPKAGLYDKDGKMIASWETLTQKYKMSCETDFAVKTSQYTMIPSLDKEASGAKYKTAPAYILNKGDRKKGVTLVIDESVPKIGTGAFVSCDRLEKIIIPDSVSEIGESAFMNCNNLQTINLSQNITTIKPMTFMQCDKLKDIEIHEGITNIGAFSFVYCRSLTYIDLPSSVQKIEKFAFHGCSNLEEFNMGAATPELYEDIFIQCNKLVNISTSETNSAYQTINGNLYSKNGKTLVQYAIGKNDSTFVVPSEVTEITNSAFKESLNLIKIEIPASVAKIGKNTFDFCKNLKTVKYEGTREQWETAISDVSWKQRYQFVLYFSDGGIHFPNK